MPIKMIERPLKNPPCGIDYKEYQAFHENRCFGWSGESVNKINENLKNAGFDIVNNGLKVLWNPDDESRKICIDYGKQIVNSFK